MSCETADRTEVLQFERAFKALTTDDHFPWQYELYQRLVQADVPEVCDIPNQVEGGGRRGVRQVA
jgi:hypothetical protein